jgi:uncharacterized protein YjbJ (UPF0337 family)
VQQRWGQLNDSHLDVIAGKIQALYGIAKDGTEKQISTW